MLDTTRRVATPEGIELTLRLAGPVPRALAWSGGLAAARGDCPCGLDDRYVLRTRRHGARAHQSFFVEWLLPAAFEARWGGQTPGKRLFGIAVLNDDGTPVRWPAALTRNLLRAADFLPLLYGVGLMSILANRDFKRLGDLAAGTVVVYDSRAAARGYPGSCAGAAAGDPRAGRAARCSSSPSAPGRSRASASKSSPCCPRRSSGKSTASAQLRALSAWRTISADGNEADPFEAAHEREWAEFEMFVEQGRGSTRPRCRRASGACARRSRRRPALL